MKAKGTRKDDDNRLDELVNAVLGSPKYRHITTDLVRRVGKRELAARRNLKTAVKATKNKLHQIGGAYFEARLDYPAMLAQLRQTADSPEQFRQTCHDLMRLHTSTRERLPHLGDFYTETLADVSEVRVVMDLACGLNPLAHAWMPFGDEVEYIAYDIYADMVDFVGEFLQMVGGNGRAHVCDLVSQPPTEQADIILLLKTLPVLEQVEKGAASSLLDALNARNLLITFPTHSLGGRSKGMVQTYESLFHTWAERRNWQFRRFEYPSELAFLVEQDSLTPKSDSYS